MTEQLLSEARISFAQLAREQGVSIPTVWRWAQRGIRGQVLESLSVGGRRFTTAEAFARFIARSNGERVAASHAPRRRARQIELAERRAAELGV